jgi:filamentous hemagglutinin family protein
LPTPAQAQIVPDNTLGPGNTSILNTHGIRTDITGGLQRNSALFHSFDQFNVGTNAQVYFANPVNVQNIFSRVTGKNLSSIDGLLGVSGNANLFVMNPNGIIFGPNARLDVSGSFLATTANALEFADAQKFEATGARAVPLVEVNIPIGLQMGTNAPAMITNRGHLATGQNLTLAAGNLELQGRLNAGGNLTLNATDTVTIRDTVTEPFLARSGGDMTIQGNQSIDILALNHLANTPFVSGGHLTLISDGLISTDAHFTAGKNFTVQTLAGEIGNFVSLYDPIINAGGNFNVNNYTGASLQVNAGGDIDYGNVVIDAIDAAVDPFRPAFVLRSGGNITANGDVSTTVAGGVLRVDFEAVGNINLSGISPNAPRRITALSNATNNFSVIRLRSTGGSIFLNNAALSVSNTNPTAALGAGDIIIEAARDIDISNSVLESTGDFGQIIIGGTLGERLTIRKSSLTTSNSLNLAGGGTGGLISINIPGSAAVSSSIAIVDSSLRAASSNAANGGRVALTAGNAGTINIFSSLLDASINGTGTATIGRQGGIFLAAPNGNILLDTNSFVTTAISGGAPSTARGGAIDVTATNGTVTVRGSSTLNATTSSAAPGGNITIGANQATITGSSLVSTTVQTGSAATAQGGNITISANDFALTQGGRVQANTFAAGNAGNIELSFTNTAAISGFDPASFLYSGMLTETRSGAVGIGGNITINPAPSGLVGNLTISDGGFLSARTLSTATGGNVAININNLNITNGGQVLTSALSFGNAGGISVNAAGAVTISGSRTAPANPSSPFVNPAFPVISLDGRTRLTAASPLVEDSATLPYFSLQRNPDNAPGTIFAANAANGSAIGGVNLGAGNAFDYYSFSINQDGSRAIFDVDNAASVGAVGSTFVDTELFLFDAQTGQLLASNDDFFPAEGAAGGSTSSLDSRLAFNFNQAGQYILGVAKFNATASNGNPITMVGASPPMDANSAYRLQVSLQNQGGGNFSLADRNPNQGLNSGLFAQTLSGGQGGSINVQAAAFTLENNAEINATTVGAANGGSISINTSNLTGLPRSTPILNIRNGGTISAAVVRADKNSFGTGTGGSVTLTANNGSIAMDNLALVSASTTGSGQGGSVVVRTIGGGSLAMTNGSRIEAQSQGEGAPGSIQLEAPDITISGSALWGGEPLFSGLYVSAENQNTAQGGSITINAAANRGNRLVISDGAVLSALNRSDNPGGNITIDVNDVQLLDGGQILTTAEGTGRAGDITLNVANLTIAGVGTFRGRQNIATGSGQLLEAETNDSLTGAQAIGNNFSLVTDPNIESSLVIPHVTVRGTGNGTFDYYAFNVTAGNRGIFDMDGDLDNNNALDAGAFDTQLFLFDSAGNVLAQNDDFRTTAGGRGSSPSLGTGGAFDSYIDYVFTNPGTYYLGVARFISSASGAVPTPIQGNPPAAGGNYALQVSIDQRNTRNANQGISSGLFAQSTGVGGAAGNITVNATGTGLVTLNNGAQISGSTVSGQGGSINLNGVSTLQVNNSLIATSTTGNNGSAGAIAIAANTVQINGVLPNGVLPGGTPPTGGLAARATNGNGSAGLVSINTRQLAVQNGAAITASTDLGTGSDIVLSGLDTLDLDNGTISASTQTGRAGNLTVNGGGTAATAITLRNNSSLALAANDPNGAGTAGNISLNTRQLFLDNSSIFASTAGSGQAGSLTVSANGGTADAIVLSNNSRLSLSSTGSGDSGTILLDTRLLSLNTSSISASTVSGVGDNIVLRGLDTLQLDASRIEASTVDGTAGNLLVSGAGGSNAVGSVSLNNSTLSVAATGTSAASRAGQIVLNARRVNLNNSTISASTNAGTGQGIALQGLDDLQLDNSQIQAATETGRAGNIDVNAANTVTLQNGSALSVAANPDNNPAGVGGVAGNLTVRANRLNVNSGSQITVSSPNGQAGNLIIRTNALRMDRGTLSAETGGGGANIDIAVAQEPLIVRHGSLISANASGAANGGNIKITAPFVIGQTFEDSDIVANAVQGQGGRIDITTNAIFGLRFRPKRTPLSDITASSDFGTNGSVFLNTLNLDVTRGLYNPTIVFIDASQIQSNACESTGSKAETTSELRIAGQGGVVASPTTLLPAQTTQSDWVAIAGTPSTPVSQTLPDRSLLALQSEPTYQASAICVNAWKGQQEGRTNDLRSSHLRSKR